MAKDIYKKAASQAKKELEKEVIAEIKEIYKETLQAIEDKKSEIKDLEAELKALKADLHDLEEGRLDRIKKRQEKDKVAKQTSEVDVDELEKRFPIIKQHYQDSYVQADWTYRPTIRPMAGSGGGVEYYSNSTIPNGSGGGGINAGDPLAKIMNTAQSFNGTGGGSNVMALYSKEDIADTYIVKTKYGEKAHYLG